MSKAVGDAKLLIQFLNKAYAATPTNLKIIYLYIVSAVVTSLVQVVYMGIVGSFPFNSFLSDVLSCIGTAVLPVPKFPTYSTLEKDQGMDRGLLLHREIDKTK